MEPMDIDLALNPEDRTFFEGLAAGELRIPWCDRCSGGIWPPRTRCPRCYEQATRSRTLSGRGTVYSFSVVHRGDGPFAGRAPYVYAYVQLEDGPVIPANVVGAGADDLVVGARVRLVEPGSRDDGLAGAAFAVDATAPS